MGETQYRGRDSRLVAPALHPVRQLRDGLSAREHPCAPVRRIAAGGRTAPFPVGAAGGPWLPRQAVHPAGVGRGLHGVSTVRRSLSRQKRRPGGRARTGDDSERRRDRRRGASTFRLLRIAARGDVDDGRRGARARGAVPHAAVRVLGSVRRLRRNALPATAHPALRRSTARRECHRVLVDLRRQSSDDAVVVQQGRTRARVGELAVRGQRGVRAGISRVDRQAP